MNQWFRIYNDVHSDPKVQTLIPVVFRAWVNFLCLCSMHDGVLPPIDEVSFRLHLKPHKAVEFRDILVSKNLFEHVEGKGYMPHNWSGRQFKSDRSTERVKRFRNAERNVSETANETGPEQSRTDTEQKQNRAEEKRAPKTRAPRATSVPNQFVPTETLKEWASKLGGAIDLGTETEKFLFHHRSKGSTFKNWDAAWQKWMRNAAEWGSARTGGNWAAGDSWKHVGKEVEDEHPDYRGETARNAQEVVRARRAKAEEVS